MLCYLNYLKAHFHNVSFNVLFDIFVWSVLVFLSTFSHYPTHWRHNRSKRYSGYLLTIYEKLLGWLTCRQGSEIVPYLPPVVCKVPQQKIIHAAFSQETAEAGLLRLHVADRAPWSWQPPSPPCREGRPWGGQQEPGAWGRCSWGCCCSCGVTAPVGLLLLGHWVAVISVAGALTTFCFGSNSLKLI